MIIKNATQVGNPVIRRKSKKITDVNSKEVKKTVKDLIDSMRHHSLVGMAAPQINKGFRIFVTEIRKTNVRSNNKKSDMDEVRVYINPKITSVSEKTNKGWEGCGSVACAGLFAKVERPKEVTVDAVDEKGKKFSLEAKGLLARVIQHEIDHLNGVIFTDKADRSTYMSKEEYLSMVSK